MLKKFQMTKHDIDNGKKHCATECPIALTIGRQIAVDWLFVGFISVVNVGMDTPCFILPTPRVCVDFMRRFDAGEPVLPIEFELEVP